MPLYQRENGFWYIDVITPDGQRIRRSTGTKDKRQAEELHDKIKHDFWRQSRLKEIPKYTWDEAVLRWIQEKKDKRSLKSDLSRLRNLPELRGILLHELTRDNIMYVIQSKHCGNSTKNRYIAIIRSILNACLKDWGWLNEIPYLKQYQEQKKRIRWLKPKEAERLISCLPAYMAAMARFSLATGLRQRNVFNLKWDQINMVTKVATYYPDEMKSGHALGIVLNETAIKVLLDQVGKHRKYVFVHSKNKPVKTLNSKVWHKALEKADIENFRWHDLRHTWASWLVQSGVSLYALKEMGGWESIEMVQKYAHLSPTHLHQHAKAIDEIMEKSHNSVTAEIVA